MAHRIEPFRDYSEHEVINLFALDLSAVKSLNADGNAAVAETLAGMKNLSSGQWDSGVVVEVSAGDLPQDAPGDWAAKDADLRAYLGHAHDNAHIGFNGMPYNKMTVKPALGTGKALGITLRQTVAYDENGENLLRYPVKKDELQAVGPGETVPVLTRGLVLLNQSAFVKNDAGVRQLPSAVGQRLEVAKGFAADHTAADQGCLRVADADAGDDNEVIELDVGIVLAIDSTLKKYLCKLSF